MLAPRPPQSKAAISHCLWLGVVAIVSAGSAAAIDLPSALGSTSTVQAQRRCFVDHVRVSGFFAHRGEAYVMGIDGYRIASISVRVGDTVTADQDVIQLEPATPVAVGAPGQPAAAGRALPPITLRAPAAGLVSASSARTGGLASARGDPLLRIVTDQELDLVVDLPSAFVARVRAGGGARILKEDGQDMKTTVRVAPSDIDVRTQFGRAFLAVPAGSGWRAGAFGRAFVDTDESCGPSVPKGSILRQNNATSVLVVKGGRSEIRRVEVGLSSNDHVEIRSGLAEGENVIANAAGAM